MSRSGVSELNEVDLMSLATQERKKSLSSFTAKEAFKLLGVRELQRWEMAAAPVPISDFFRQRLARLQRFDLESLELSKSGIVQNLVD